MQGHMIVSVVSLLAVAFCVPNVAAGGECDDCNTINGDGAKPCGRGYTCQRITLGDRGQCKCVDSSNWAKSMYGKNNVGCWRGLEGTLARLRLVGDRCSKENIAGEPKATPGYKHPFTVPPNVNVDNARLECGDCNTYEPKMKCATTLFFGKKLKCQRLSLGANSRCKCVLDGTNWIDSLYTINSQNCWVGPEAHPGAQNPQMTNEGDECDKAHIEAETPLNKDRVNPPEKTIRVSS